MQDILDQIATGKSINTQGTTSATTSKSYPAISSFSTTKRPARPILDGLSWLWRTWQDTAPSAKPAGQKVPTYNDITSGRQTYSPNSFNTDDGLDPVDTLPVSIFFLKIFLMILLFF